MSTIEYILPREFYLSIDEVKYKKPIASLPFKSQPHKMIKHTEIIRRQSFFFGEMSHLNGMNFIQGLYGKYLLAANDSSRLAYITCKAIINELAFCLFFIYYLFSLFYFHWVCSIQRICTS